eukprot:934725_1
MAEEVDSEIHRESISRSIQYSDYSSGEDIQPSTQSQPLPEDDDSSSSSYSTTTTTTKQTIEKRTSSKIQSKLNKMQSKFENETKPKPRKRNSSNSGLTQSEKKTKLAARWQRLLAANNSDKNKKLHESQQVNKPIKIHNIHNGTLKIHNNNNNNGTLKNNNIKNNNQYNGLTPIQIWVKKK